MQSFGVIPFISNYKVTFKQQLNDEKKMKKKERKK